MSDESVLPFLSTFDPPEQAEGSLDPLGLYSIADALGVRLAPGVRERQSKPRYLTLALVGFAACGDDVMEAGDKKQLPAWLVYEWLVVESLVRHFRGKQPALHGVPGQGKVQATIDAQDVVCARTYLKTPTVFGFHGIYRVLGLKAGLYDGGGRALDAGFRILNAWERDQGLTGFVSGDGPGLEFRRGIKRAVQSALETRSSRDPGSSLRGLIASHLLPHSPGPKERDALWESLTSNDQLRGEYARLLTSPDGQKTWLGTEQSEATFHEWAIKGASLPMQQLLKAIRAFEHFARLVTDAFNEMRWRMTLERAPVDVAWLAGGEATRRASQMGLVAYGRALDHLGDIDPGLRVRAEAAFQWVGESSGANAFVLSLLEHHGRVQKNKPPDGKRTWFDIFGDGRVAIRPAYTVDEFTANPEGYVQAYRTNPIWSFACDLGRATPDDKERP